MKLPTAFLRDADRRRCRWMLRRARLQPAHRQTLEPLDEKRSLSESERTLVRVLFRLYRPGPVERARPTQDQHANV